MFTGNKNIYLN